MAGIRQFPNGTWQFTFKKSGVLAKPVYMTFPTREEGERYAARVEALLNQGVVPAEFNKELGPRTLGSLADEWLRDAHPSKKDQEKINLICKEHGRLALLKIDAAWVDAWISGMKRVRRFSPNTIRAYVGALARCTDWGMRKGYVKFPDQPLRTLPNGYAQYTQTDAALAGGRKKDVERDRRLEKGEYEKILAVIEKGVLPRKQRPFVIEHKAAVKMLFILALESAMRMREMYTLQVKQVDFDKRTVFLDKTKNGDRRQVPLSSVARAQLQEFIPEDAHEDDFVFPFWSGAPGKLAETSDRLSKLYKNIFAVAGCEGLTFHDLRHEATSRFFEKTSLSELEIAKITGHRDMRSLMRYANLRGATMVDKLW